MRGNDDSYLPILNPVNNEHVFNVEDKASLFLFLSHYKINAKNMVLPENEIKLDHILEDIILTEAEVADLISIIDV